MTVAVPGVRLSRRQWGPDETGLIPRDWHGASGGPLLTLIASTDGEVVRRAHSGLSFTLVPGRVGLADAAVEVTGAIPVATPRPPVSPKVDLARFETMEHLMGQPVRELLVPTRGGKLNKVTFWVGPDASRSTWAQTRYVVENLRLNLRRYKGNDSTPSRS